MQIAEKKLTDIKSAAGEQKKTVLVVEDDVGLNRLIRKALAREGYQTEQALTGADAITNMVKDPDKILLLDYILPDMNGEQVIMALREENLDIFLIIMTGHGDERIAVDMMKLGIRDYIVKEPNFVDRLPGILKRVSKEIATEAELARAEKTLRRAAQQWQMTFDGINDAICLLDNEMNITQCNNAMSKFLGKEPEEIIGSNCFELVHCTRGPIEDCPLVLMKKTKQREQKILQVKDKWLDIVVHPLFDEKGDLNGAIHVISDITEHKQYENQIKSQTDFMRNVMESLTHPFYVIDVKDFTIKMANTASGLKDKQEGRTCHELTHHQKNPCESDDHVCPLKEVQRTGKPVSTEHTHLDENGQEKIVEVHGFPIFDNNGCVTQMIVYSLDITERKQAEEEKEKLQDQLNQTYKMEAIGQLAGGIAHDFNNILGGIVGYTDVIALEMGVESVLFGYVTKIKNAALKASDLIRKLLIFARKSRVELTSIDIHDLLKQIIELLFHTIDRRIEIKSELNAEKYIVRGDRNQIENMLLNIGINARDAMPEGGTLTFETETVDLEADNMPDESVNVIPGKYLKIMIKDTGAGMDSSILDHIFEPFFSTKEVGKGTGLGLASVYGSVKQHNGHIIAKSELGKGSMFNIFLPVIEKEEKVKPKKKTGVVRKGEGSILVVDDEVPIREALFETLTDAGYEVICCCNGIEAVEYYEENHENINVVVLDLIMPKMSGLDCFRKLKEINTDVKVVVVSGNSGVGDINQILDEGADTFVEKPFDIEQLSEAISEVLTK